MPDGSDPINNYGTSLALELLPYWTKGRIGSMEGLYFESSATTSFHFLTVSELAAHPSNPVRGLVYGTLDDFDRGVKHLEMLGVRYYMAWTPEAAGEGRREPGSRGSSRRSPITTVVDPKGWQRLRGRRLRARAGAASTSRSSRKTHAGTTSSCFGQAPPAAGTHDPELGAWECSAAGWYLNDKLLGVPWTQTGPKDWARVDAADLANAPRKRLDPVKVTQTREGPDQDLLPRRQGRRAGRGEGVVLPELAGARRRRSVPARAEPDGRDPARARRVAHLRADAGRLARPHPHARRVWSASSLLVRWKGARQVLRVTRRRPSGPIERRRPAAVARHR